MVTDEDVFIQHTDTDAPYARFAAGRLGIVQRHLSHSSSCRRLQHPQRPRGSVPRSRAPLWLSTTIRRLCCRLARGRRAPQTEPPACAVVRHSAPLVGWRRHNERKVPGQNWQSFTNCLADAFSNADATLTDRRARYGKPGSPKTRSALPTGSPANSSVSPTAAVPVKPRSRPPPTHPLWLRQDRAYQTAAAQFYALDYDQAHAGLSRRCADRASPWSQLARYSLLVFIFARLLSPDMCCRENQCKR